MRKKKIIVWSLSLETVKIGQIMSGFTGKES